ncbi:secreted RxLR effector protein 161-like [Cryptomeria japonica]|uniref:secreted RxLR effector protein 161-like n=1 Tax=Cryptomeria japonica TaxID=3369 RepID=UPI0027D9E866|nr:secreted RxLR effector protein 161-like [Cryptomeria japonica]
MTHCSQLVIPALQGTKLFVEDCPKYRTEMEDMTRVPYASVVGILMYAMVCTRPDIVQAVGVLSWFMNNPRWVHWDAVKRVFKYLRGDIDSRRSIGGYVFTIFGGAVSWMSKQQVVVALSTTEVESMAATHACK